MNKLIMLLFLLPLSNRADLNTYKGVIPEVTVVSPLYTKEFSKALIKDLEGYSELAYSDGDGYSVCYGTRSYLGERVNKEVCEERLDILLDKVWDKLLSKYDLTTSQVAILSVFYWNVNIGEDLDKAIKKKDFCNIENMMLQYINYKGKPNSVLLERRCWELFYLKKAYKNR